MLESRATSSRFQFTLLAMLLGLVGATAWFTYNAVHAANQSSNTLVNKLSDEPSQKNSITNYKQCVAASGSIIQQSYPEVCVSKSGQRFVNK